MPLTIRRHARIPRQQTGNQPWASINVRTGEKPLDAARFPFADEPLINTKDGPVPMSIWQETITKPAASE